MEDKDIVIAFLMALNNEDFKEAKSYLSDDMQFVGVLGSTDGRDAYIKSMEKMRFKYDIKKIMTDGGDISIFCDIDMGNVKVFCSNWYHVQNNKIDNLKAIFDPRPVLEVQKK
jgi:hypothetical protein